MAPWLTTGLLAKIWGQYTMGARNLRHKSASRKPSSKALWHRKITPFLSAGKEIWASVAQASSRLTSPIKPTPVRYKSPTRMHSSNSRRIPKPIVQEWPGLTRMPQVLLVEIKADRLWWGRLTTTWLQLSNNSKRSSIKWEMTKFVYSNIRPALSKLVWQGQLNPWKPNRFTCLPSKHHPAHNSNHRKRWLWQDWVSLLRMCFATTRAMKLSRQPSQRDRVKEAHSCQKSNQLGTKRPR